MSRVIRKENFSKKYHVPHEIRQKQRKNGHAHSGFLLLDRQLPDLLIKLYLVRNQKEIVMEITPLKFKTALKQRLALHQLIGSFTGKLRHSCRLVCNLNHGVFPVVPAGNLEKIIKTVGTAETHSPCKYQFFSILQGEINEERF